MLHKVIRLFYDFEEEEKWLAEMSAKGLNLQAVEFGFVYFFAKGVPNQYIYRIERLEHFPSHPESQVYIAFMEETGAEFIAKCKKYVYFRKDAAEGDFVLFSDIASRIRHYKRVCRMLGLAFAVEAGIGVSYSTFFIWFLVREGRMLSGYIFVILLATVFAVVIGTPFIKFKRKIKSLEKQKWIVES